MRGFVWHRLRPALLSALLILVSTAALGMWGSAGMMMAGAGTLLAASDSAPASPPSTTSTAYVMMGLGCTIVPVGTGRVLFMIGGNMGNSGAGVQSNVQLYYGSGTPPVNGAAPTGTKILNGGRAFVAAAANYLGAYQHDAIVTGLSLGTSYWFDDALQTLTAGTASLTNVHCSALEF